MAAAGDRGYNARIANDIVLFIIPGLMKLRVAMIIIASAFASAPFAFGGTDRSANSSIGISDEPPRFDFAIESAYLFGAFNPPRNYEISADYLRNREPLLRDESGTALQLCPPR